MGQTLINDVLISESGTKVKGKSSHDTNLKNLESVLGNSSSLDLPITRFQIIAAQMEDPSLRKCLSTVLSYEAAKKRHTAYFVDDGLLIRKWCSKVDDDWDWNVVYHVLVPITYRFHVLCLAHEHVLSGHLGLTKTNNRILFFLARFDT